MRRHLVVAAALVTALVSADVAAAKGPERASISGAGVNALAVHGQGEMGPGTPLGALVDLGGYFPQMFGQVPDPTLKAQPKGTLGPRYVVTYIVPGPHGSRAASSRSSIRTRSPFP